jgi:hypothetical protein
MSAGALWRGTESSAFDAAGQAFLELDGIYGDIERGRSRMPYDAFTVRLRFGGGSGFSEARVRGRLLGELVWNDKFDFKILQSYDFQANDAYRTGAQSVEGALGTSLALSSRIRMWVLGWGGLTVLGAIDSLPLGVTEAPEEPEEPEGEGGGQGVSEGPRYYDYGPGSTFGATAVFRRDERIFAVLLYEGRQLYSLDGVRANHLLQRVRLDGLLPLRGALGIGASAEYFDRRTFFQDVNRTVATYHYPQVRAFFTWSVS